MTEHTIPHEKLRRKENSAHQQAITDAAKAYRAALFDFAEGRIPLALLIDRCQRLRAALRRRPNEAAA